MSWGLYKDDSGRQLMIHGGGEVVQLWRASLQHQLQRIAVKVGAASVLCQLTLGIFQLPMLM